MATFTPGAHFETANVRNLLRAAGTEISEAMCLGIGGGIAAGYQFCPSAQSYEWADGSGVQLVPRVKMMTTNGAWYRDTFTRLGVETDARESTGKKAAHANLLAGLDAGKLVVAWTTPLGLAQTLTWKATCGMYTVLVLSNWRFSNFAHSALHPLVVGEFACFWLAATESGRVVGRPGSAVDFRCTRFRAAALFRSNRRGRAGGRFQCGKFPSRTDFRSQQRYLWSVDRGVLAWEFGHRN